MLANQMSWLARHSRALAACAVLAALTTSAVPADASAASTPSRKQVSYLGYSFKIPSSWPVINDSDHPRDCVRFDRHAVYLGAPGVNQACPSWLLGTTEALLIQPGPAAAGRTSAENPTSREITVTARRIRLMATFDTDPTQIYRILASATLPAPVIKVPDPAQFAAYRDAAPIPATQRTEPRTLEASTRELGAAAVVSGAGQHWRQLATAARQRKRTAPALPAEVTDYHGRGFDSCTAPSRAYMRAWLRSSPYRAVGIYIGGADRACDQRNLTPGWVRHEARARWRFIPMYAGPQAALGELGSPARQGRRAAADAVSQAQWLGFGPQTPIYYDMEAYPPRYTAVALRFLSAWTVRLHRLGYRSGVYSSSDSGIADLAQRYSGHLYAMPDVIYDALWNGSPNTADKVYQSDEWSNHQRLHQYRGNVTQTHGHDTIDIDQDYLNVDLPVLGGTSQASPAVSRPDGAVYAFFAGADHRLWREVYSARSGWQRPVDMGGAVDSVPSAVSIGSRAIDVFYQGADGDLREVSFRPGRGWAPARRLAMMGILGGAPRAVAAAGGVVDVFWRGSADKHLWHGQFIPGIGWKGPQRLGGSLSSYPSPVESSSGTIEVFWAGAHRGLCHVTRGLGGHWSRPASLGMGPLGGPPHATAQERGTIEVFWKGSGNHQVWAAFRGPGGWRGPRDLGGHVSYAPWPVTAAGSVRILWRGQDGRLWQAQHKPQDGWRAPVELGMGSLVSGPFAAVGSASSMLKVFWIGRGGGLWSAALSRRGTWTRPRSLGGHVA